MEYTIKQLAPGQDPKVMALAVDTPYIEPSDEYPTTTIPVRTVELHHGCDTLSRDAVDRANLDLPSMSLSKLCRDARALGLMPVFWRMDEDHREVRVHLWAREQ